MLKPVDSPMVVEVRRVSGEGADKRAVLGIRLVGKAVRWDVDSKVTDR